VRGPLAAAAARPAVNVVNLPTHINARLQRLVGDLEGFMVRDLNRARAALQEITGEIEVVPDKAAKRLVAKVWLNEMTPFRASGSSRIFVVAGAVLSLALPYPPSFSQAALGPVVQRQQDGTLPRPPVIPRPRFTLDCPGSRLPAPPDRCNRVRSRCGDELSA